MRSRRDDARLDAFIHDRTLRHIGVIEPDQPTAVSHLLWREDYERRARGEFTPDEREAIRAHLGLGPFDRRAVSGRVSPTEGDAT